MGTTTGASSRDKEKAHRKSMALAHKEHLKNLQEIDDLRGIDKVKYDISVLKSNIKLCQYDLDGQFKGNTAIIHKINIMNEQMNIKIEELKKLEGEQTNVTSGN